MRRVLLALTAAFLLVVVSGCGTEIALNSDRYDCLIYCGVREDVDGLSREYHSLWLGWFFILDFPFSLGVDTLFLPGTLIYEVFREHSKPKSKPTTSEHAEPTDPGPK
ncbi:MAG TPA: YceK/YidQ family lipoprotein [Planctomycetota bacterium]|nr:YceK/YidQ family lipoprotein [Planctomycetota bacterium]